MYHWTKILIQTKIVIKDWRKINIFFLSSVILNTTVPGWCKIRFRVFVTVFFIKILNKKNEERINDLACLLLANKMFLSRYTYTLIHKLE